LKRWFISNKNCYCFLNKSYCLSFVLLRTLLSFSIFYSFQLMSNHVIDNFDHLQKYFSRFVGFFKLITWLIKRVYVQCFLVEFRIVLIVFYPSFTIAIKCIRVRFIVDDIYMVVMMSSVSVWVGVHFHSSTHLKLTEYKLLP